MPHDEETGRAPATTGTGAKAAASRKAGAGARARTSGPAEPHRTADDLDRAHDPGPDVARARLEAASLDEAATEPLHTSAGHLVRVGTASWTDPTMTASGVFYPTDASTAEERLAFYASRFPVVEVDATYYALPSRRTSELWVERTPPDFVFDIKAHALLTGQPTETKRLPKAIREALPATLADKPRLYAKDLPGELLAEVWRLFADGVAPLAEAGQLGAVFLQYPKWFFTSSENRDAIREAKAALEPYGLRVAVELRDPALFTREYARVLARNHAAHVYNHWSAMPSLRQQSTRWFVEHQPFVVLRLLMPQGARYEERKRALEPFDLLRAPDPAMRDVVVELVRRALAHDREAWVLVSNKAEGSAPRTVRALAEMLTR